MFLFIDCIEVLVGPPHKFFYIQVTLFILYVHFNPLYFQKICNIDYLLKSTRCTNTFSGFSIFRLLVGWATLCTSAFCLVREEGGMCVTLYLWMWIRLRFLDKAIILECLKRYRVTVTAVRTAMRRAFLLRSFGAKSCTRA